MGLLNPLDWKQIPGYEGRYWINRSGLVCNSEGHTIKSSPSKSGLQVELRKPGQRDRFLVKDLLKLAYEEGMPCL